MIEPTESEDKQEMDRFCDALVCKFHYLVWHVDHFYEHKFERSCPLRASKKFPCFIFQISDKK